VSPESKDSIHHGENLVTRAFERLRPDGHYWPEVGYLPGVHQIDGVLWDEKVGLFIVEVKGVTIGAIESQSLQSMKIRGRELGRSPQRQALDAIHSLRDYLAAHGVKHSFMTPLVWWPRISREEWLDRWPSEPFAVLAERMLFAEDLALAPDALRERLKTISKDPPIGRPIHRKFIHNDNQYRQFAAIFEDDILVPPAPAVELPVEPSEEERVKAPFVTLWFQGAKTNMCFPVQTPAILGRYDQARGEVGLDLSSVPCADGISRQHACIRKEGDSYVLVDLGSRNGTFVKRADFERVTRAELTDGTRFALSNVQLQFELLEVG
jgi:hypothetical protein